MKVHELFAYLHVADAGAAIDFYTHAFGAKEKFRLTEPGSGRIGHAELDFDGATLMISDEDPENRVRGPQPDSDATVSIHLHVDNADEFIENAEKLGATVETTSTANAAGCCGIRLDTAGISATALKRCRTTKCSGDMTRW